MNDIAERRARKNVRLYYAYSICMDFGLWAGIWIKYLIEDRGFELKYILAMDLPFWLLVAVLQAPTGALADHIGRKRILAISGVLYAITILGFGFAQNYWMLFADYVLWAVAQSTRSGADSALVYDSLRLAGREAEFPRIAGRGFAIDTFSLLCSLVAGALLAEVIGMALVIQVSAIAPLLAMAVALTMIEPPTEHEERHYWANLRSGLSFSWQHPEVRYTLLVGSVLLAGVFGPVVLMQPFLIEHHVATGLYGVYQAPLRLLTMGGAIIAFRLVNRFGVTAILVTACTTIIAGYLALAGIDMQLAFVLFALPAIFQGINKPVLDGYLNDRIPSDRRATVLSVMQLYFALQIMLVEPALGILTDDISLTAAFLFAAGYFIVLMPPLLFLWHRAQGRTGAGSLPVLEPAGAK